MNKEKKRHLLFPSPEAQRYLLSTRWLQTHRMARTIAYLLGGLFVTTIVGLLLLPWQQTSSGIGRVVALNPLERQQVLSAPVKGRVIKWYVTEGSFVRKGQLIAQMEDNDPLALRRIREQGVTAQEQIQLLLQQAKAYQNKVKSLKSTRKLHLRANSLKVKMTRQKVRALRQKLRALRASYQTALLNLKRKKKLHKDAIVSNRSLELSALKVAKYRASLEGIRADIVSAQADTLAQRAYRLKEGASDQSKIDSARAAFQAAKNKVAYMKRDIAKLNVKQSRQESQTIRAARDCVVLRLMVTQDSEILKPGDPIATIVPRVTSMAVELWVHGNDVPLITVGRHVRLQFEGWPAVQFAGWPSVAVGTFGGRVKQVDVATSQSGKFRVVIARDTKDSDWPKSPFLRQGMRVKGWILLNEVRLGYELWRQLNGFPPSFDQPLKYKPKTSIKKAKKS